MRVLSPSVYNYMRGMKLCDIVVGLEEVLHDDDGEIMGLLNKVWVGFKIEAMVMGCYIARCYIAI